MRYRILQQNGRTRGPEGDTLLPKSEIEQLERDFQEMQAALEAWVELDKLKEGDGFQKGFELQTKALRLTDEALARTDGHNTESVNYIPGKGATLHEGIEKEGEDEVTDSCPHCGKELHRDRNLCCKECGKEVERG